MSNANHQYWATVSGSTRNQIAVDIKLLEDWGISAIEFRLDLVPMELWDTVLTDLAPSVPWWVAHFGTGSEAEVAKKAILATTRSKADGGIFHSRCENIDELIKACRDAGKDYAAPFHSQEPLTFEGAMAEYAHQQSLSPAFRKIAVRPKSFGDAHALLEATRLCAKDGGAPVVGAVFGEHRWARLAMQTVGSTISFIVARKLPNEVGGDDEQLQLAELKHLLEVRGLMSPHQVVREYEDSLA